MTNDELVKTVTILKELAMHTPEGRAAFVQAAEQYGIWCVQDGAWCGSFRGTRAEADAEVDHWRSGERAWRCGRPLLLIGAVNAPSSP